MNYRLARLVLIVALLGALMLGALPATSAPTGKIVTSEITIAGGLVAYFLTYESALLRSKGSVKQAEQVMRATTDVASGGTISLNQIRGLIIVDVANASGDHWREEFENFRFCWNKSLAIDASAPSNLSSKPGTAVALAPPVPAPTLTPLAYPTPTCDDLIANVLANIKGKLMPPPGSPTPSPEKILSAFNAKVDARDLLPVLTSAPSLLTQVRKQEVDSHALENYLRARFLVVAGEDVAAAIVSHANAFVSPLDNTTNVQKFVTDCLLQLSPFECSAHLAEIEGAFAAAQQHRDACAWVRHVWMPSYSAIKLWANAKAAVTWRDRVGRPKPFVMATPLDISAYNKSDQKADIDGIDLMDLGSPPGC